MAELKGHKAGATAVLWTPDDKALISASRDRTLRIRDWKRGTLLRTLKGCKGLVHRLGTIMGNYLGRLSQLGRFGHGIGVTVSKLRLGNHASGGCTPSLQTPTTNSGWWLGVMKGCGSFFVNGSSAHQHTLVLAHCFALHPEGVLVAAGDSEEAIWL